MPERVQSIGREVLGAEPTDINRAGRGSNYVYRFYVDNHQYYLKFASEQKQELLRYELDCLNQLHDWSLPAPEIVAHSEHEATSHWLLMKSGGENLTLFLDQYPHLLIDAGKLLANYHARQLGQFGKFHNGEVVPHDMRNSRLKRLANRLVRCASGEHISNETASKLQRTLLSYQPSGTPVLCHGELTLPHLLVDAQKLTMAIDWSYMAALPSAYDLAAVELYCDISGFEFDTFMEGYGLSPLEFRNDPNRLTCRIIHAVRQFVPKQKSRNYERIRTVLFQLAREVA